MQEVDPTSFYSAFASLREEDAVDPFVLSRILHMYCGFHYRALMGGKSKRTAYQEIFPLTSFHHGFRIRQNPFEIVSFLVYLFGKKDKLFNYCEIGSCSGGTFYVIDSYLRAFAPKYSRGTMLDLNKPLALKQYKKVYPVTFIRMNSRDFKPDQRYSVCLIDGDHSLEGVTRDWETMRDWCDYIAFHDIFHPKYPGITTLWEQLKSQYSHVEFFDKNWERYCSKPIGIGVLELNDRGECE